MNRPLTERRQINDYGDEVTYTPLYPCYRCPRQKSILMPHLSAVNPTMRPAIKERTVDRDRTLGDTQVFDLSCGHTYASLGDLGPLAPDLILHDFKEGRWSFVNHIGEARITVGAFDPAKAFAMDLSMQIYNHRYDPVEVIFHLLAAYAEDEFGRSGTDAYILRDNAGTAFTVTVTESTEEDDDYDPTDT